MSEARGPIGSQLIGVWSLVSLTEEREGREDTFPLGEKPEGFLIYTADGFISAQLMRPGRSDGQEAESDYLAYCGSYDVDEEGGTVTHVPIVSLIPSWIRERQIRRIAISGENLTLQTPAVSGEDGSCFHYRLEWQKASPPT
jgi:hypothetical protein